MREPIIPLACHWHQQVSRLQLLPSAPCQQNCRPSAAAFACQALWRQAVEAAWASQVFGKLQPSCSVCNQPTTGTHLYLITRCVQNSKVLQMCSYPVLIAGICIRLCLHGLQPLVLFLSLQVLPICREPLQFNTLVTFNADSFEKLVTEQILPVAICYRLTCRTVAAALAARPVHAACRSPLWR